MSSKESAPAKSTEHAKPVSIQEGVASQVASRHDQASAGQQQVSSGAVAGKAASPQRHEDNPVVYFDVTIGGMFLSPSIPSLSFRVKYLRATGSLLYLTWK